eukprot:CAMPEP_0174374436 /NCGR_PEP_ID=MMETSP0811_2-20130205/110864_1 /TAXON_ID=73025 ORGANISM="Eutreptiella gymnastica-like, Strain CCMP1594" /NCGR_SAMPLE_ID=MMETSP0811_2 /ASSEMBLY_ACC=CAM_ASM_000667 /LENGTH=60 /DNA_ID=CAMNT_0015523743 /DNA_START=94 /DNA_END=272 /DNA_ORIENTATION=-
MREQPPGGRSKGQRRVCAFRIGLLWQLCLSGSPAAISGFDCRSAAQAGQQEHDGVPVPFP